MTRRARSGNTQKHQKMPGDATKWGEFDLQKANESSSEKKIKSESMKRHSDSDSAINHQPVCKKKRKLDSSNAKKSFEKNSTNSIIANKERTDSNLVSENLTQDIHLNTSPRSISNSVKKSSDERSISSPKKRKKVKKNNACNSETVETSTNVTEKKKKVKKLKEKSAKNGISVLPSKVERKLFNIKRTLKEKGLPVHVINEIMQKERKKELLKFRKTFIESSEPSSKRPKVCFNCRQPGHMFADCPNKSESSGQKSGICFKCGSVGHVSYKCSKNIEGFPLANCFICKEKGHISRDCPKNPQGVYPFGGKCNLCGNVNHKKKDCPSLKKKKEEDLPITLDTIKDATSIDEEVMVKSDKVKKKTVKKLKVVKF